MSSGTPELTALRDLVTRLEQVGIEYMLTGSLAASYYARPRMTRDIDIVLAPSDAAVPGLARMLGEGYHADAEEIVEAFRSRRPCNILHLGSVAKIDLIPRKEGEYRRTEFERRRRVVFAGIELWIVTREDLILSKLDWARETRSELQLRDVSLLLEGGVDRAYLDKWAEMLGVGRLLREVPGE
jgi:hypothetical protein